jgi:hypothetical protein
MLLLVFERKVHAVSTELHAGLPDVEHFEEESALQELRVHLLDATDLCKDHDVRNDASSCASALPYLQGWCIE